MGNYADMFDNRKQMMKKLKKKNYEANMNEFMGRYDSYLKQMTDHVETAGDKKKAAQEIADIFVKDVEGRFADKRGKIKGYVQIDLNFFMIYYVFPAILKTGHENCKMIADALCTKWGSYFKDSKIGYTDYNSIYNAFREKRFGIF